MQALANIGTLSATVVLLLAGVIGGVLDDVPFRIYLAITLFPR